MGQHTVRVTRAAAVLIWAALLAGCSTTATAPTTSAASRPNVPGAVDPRVTQATIGSTICTPGWSTKVRPLQADTETLKKKLYRDEHATGGLAGYELDHLIPLEVGGSPFDPVNLWLEPITAAKRADKIENQAHADVCAGRSTLAVGQRAVIDWKQAHG